MQISIQQKVHPGYGAKHCSRDIMMFDATRLGFVIVPYIPGSTAIRMPLVIGMYELKISAVESLTPIHKPRPENSA